MAEQDRQDGKTAGEGDFRSLFEESLHAVKPGQVVRGRVVAVNETHVTVDVGYKTEGQIPIGEFLDKSGKLTVQVGDEVDVFFDSSEGENGGIALSRARAQSIRAWERIERAYAQGEPIEGVIVGRVKGGFKVDIGVAAFLPGSHVDIRPNRNLDKFIGQRDRFLVLKYNRGRNNVVVSRRQLIEKERQALKEDTLKVLEEGVILEGTVKTLTGYAAFVDVGGIDGILHITDMCWGRIGHPSELVKVGERVKVVVLKFDPERERLSLGMKQLTPDPWTSVQRKYPVGSRVPGRVVSLTDYGAFVELEKGVEGLIHVSEMSWTKKIVHPSKVVRVGEAVEVQVLSVDPVQRRIALGLKQVIPNPWESLKSRYPVGSVIKGPVRNVTDFGLFVEVEEGIEGLVHISDLHWVKKVKHPSELYKKGDVVEAKVLGVDVPNQRLSLGIKQLTPDPWELAARRYPVGTKVKGEVTSVPDFGVFVKLEEGIEGLVHVSQLSFERVDKPSSLYKVGDPIEAEVIHVDPQQRRIGLSVRALRRTEERQEMDNYLKREREAAKFSFDTILNQELRLDREDSSEGAEKRKGGNP